MLPMLGLASLSLALVAYGNMSYIDVSAEEYELYAIAENTLNVTVNSSEELRLSPTGEGSFAHKQVAVTVNTNNENGYQLGMMTDTTDLTRTSVLPDGTTPVIPTLSNDGTCTEEAEDCNFEMNAWGWGYSVGSGSPTYKPMAKNTLLASSESVVNNATTNLDFGVRLNNLTPAGDYKVDLTFIALANTVAPITFEDAFQMNGKEKIAAGNDGMYTGQEFYKMQDMNSDICNAVTTPETVYDWATPVAQLIDVRDNNVYWVAKLLDGKCWMTQNLDFDITGPLTSETTNLVAYDGESFDGASGKIYTSDQGYSKDSSGKITWTPDEIAYTIHTYDDAGIKGWSNDNYRPYTFDPGRWYETGEYFLSTLCAESGVSNNRKCDFLDADNSETYDGSPLSDYFATVPFNSNGTHGAIGNYYNWTAAVAANNTSNIASSRYSNSICPAGWGLSYHSGYRILSEKYIPGYSSNGDFNDTTFFAAPLYFVRGGSAGHDSSGINPVVLINTGFSGTYWSDAAAPTNTAAYYLELTTNKVNHIAGNYNYSRGQGRSVRCVAL